VLVDIWSGKNGLYPKEQFIGLWQRMEEMINQGRIVAHNEVYKELKRHSNKEFLSWLAAHQAQMNCSPPGAYAQAKDIIDNYLSTFKHGYRPKVSDAADPFVVALALDQDLIVFTQEKRLSNQELTQASKPKIPNVCGQYPPLECVDIKEFMEKESITLVSA
jgi:hypothetical protein